MKIKTYIRWYDMWVGAYWDRKQHTLYICLLPTWVIELHWERKKVIEIYAVLVKDGCESTNQNEKGDPV